ncbi:MAG: hypothetical protein CMM07_11105 [Rhodopirellula sp.]|nr:hypothetical protein [Rhodopirellula sp.]
MVQLTKKTYAIFIAPVRAFLAIRQAMTPASVSILLFAIVTLNIIWGFPWLGLFAACVGMLTAGCLIHFITLPSLETQFSLPNSAPQGQAFQVTIHAQNRSALPALDFGFAFATPTLPRRRWLFRRRHSPPGYSVQQSPQHNLFLRTGDSATHLAVLTYHRRGIQKLPDTVINGSFPFHLFESRVDTPSTISMPITPRPLTGDDEHAKGLLNNLGGWSHKLLSGDQLDYTGSREYEPGMAVRRWDFPSWARLGVPIVREFQSPSVQNVFLIIDTALEEHPRVSEDGTYPALEQMLSLATTAIHDLAKQTVKLRLFVTETSLHDASLLNTDTPKNDTKVSATVLSDTDTESMLIKLAAAAPIAAATADEQISTVLEIAGRSPILVLTTRRLANLNTSTLDTCTVMRTDAPQHSNLKRQTRRNRKSAPQQPEPV